MKGSAKVNLLHYKSIIGCGCRQEAGILSIIWDLKFITYLKLTLWMYIAMVNKTTRLDSRFVDLDNVPSVPPNSKGSGAGDHTQCSYCGYTGDMD